jgi:hypothetical protein
MAVCMVSYADGQRTRNNRSVSATAGTHREYRAILIGEPNEKTENVLIQLDGSSRSVAFDQPGIKITQGWM